jgi:dTDP-4-dehydrorhamnose reductase
VEGDRPDPLGPGRGRRILSRRVLITGAGGQLGRALRERFADDDVVALSHAEWDVAFPPSAELTQQDFGVVLHTAAWTDVDGAEADPQGASAVNVGGTKNAASLGAPLVAFSTDYVFDGRKREPYVESDPPNPLSAYGRSKLLGEAAAGTDALVVRTSWLFGESGNNFVRTMLRLAEVRDEVAVVDDQRGCPTYVGHLAEAVHGLIDTGVDPGVLHLAADGDCTWADFAEAVFEEGGVECRVQRITTEELGRPAARPAYGVLRSERSGAPTLPHWRDGLRECLARMPAADGR